VTIQEPVKDEQSIEAKKRSRLLQADVPMFSLNEALKIPSTIYENYAGHSTSPLNVAKAIKLLPNSSQFRMLCGSAAAYGLTDGGWNAKEIVIQPLAKRILTPLTEGDDLVAKKEAALKPRIIGEFLRRYDKSPLPKHDIALNVLIEMGVPRERVQSTYQMILDTAQAVGIIKEIKDKSFVDLTGLPAFAEPEKTGKTAVVEETQPPIDTQAEARAALAGAPKRTLGQGIFIGHGKNKVPLDQLKKILDQFKVPYKVAIDEPNLGRPISAKVKQIMELCNCAILIFTGDDELLDKDGKSVRRPSENVIHELGASSYLYENRIVLLKEEGVQFASNFSDLGHISFAKDQLEAKSMDLIKELIGFGILKIST